MSEKGFFITGTDTDVGKTFITCALNLALLQKGFKAKSIKPIQTGCAVNPKNGKLIASDVLLYNKIAKTKKPFYAFKMPASPHLAANMEKTVIDKDKIIQYCHKSIEQNDYTLVEGAGGILVPLDTNFTFLDVMRELDLPVVLVCANKLGMINHTLLSYQTLMNEGVTISCIVVNDIKDDRGLIGKDNLNFLQEIIQDTPIFHVPFMDEKRAFLQRVQKAADIFLNSMDRFIVHGEPIDKDFDTKHIWHPYTSTLKPIKAYGATRTQGNYIYLEDKKVIDGMSSWWCAIHGYNRKLINQAAIKQINTMSHVMFGGITHKPSIELTKMLLKIVPKGLEYVFYCDSGSVSVEVAIKMALQYHQARKNFQKTKILTPLGGYHGDTFGAMSVCDPVNGMHFLFQNAVAKQIFISKPSCRFDEKFDKNSIKELEETLKNCHDSIAALILEPIVQGAGGMWIYHQKYLKEAKKLCKKYDVLLICDEIATGFGRTGEMFASNYANITPDIMCIGKALTGGYMSFGATLATKDVARTISQDGGVFMHGPTFMANPLACSIACKSLEVLLQSGWKKRVKKIENILKENLILCKKLKNVEDVRVLGAIGVVQMKQNVDVQRIQEFFVLRGVWIRPFGKLIYIMPPFSITKKELILLIESIYEAIEQKKY